MTCIRISGYAAFKVLCSARQSLSYERTEKTRRTLLHCFLSPLTQSRIVSRLAVFRSIVKLGALRLLSADASFLVCFGDLQRSGFAWTSKRHECCVTRINRSFILEARQSLSMGTFCLSFS